MPPTRPPISVVLPFYGTAAEASEVLGVLGALELHGGDEAIVVDNTTAHGALVDDAPDGIRLVASPVTASAYAARNVGAELATNDWILFCDADCTPVRDLLDRYFADEPDRGCGALAGEVRGDPTQTGLIPRYVRSRRHLDQAAALAHPYKPMAVTANLLVRREAWEAVGGFQEGTRSGADAEFCWRIQEAGWTLLERPGAGVVHRHRDSLAALLRQAARDGAGGAWLDNRRPGAGARPQLAGELARALAGMVLWTATGRLERAAFKAIDGIWVVAWNIGYLTSNDAADTRRESASTVAVVAEYPLATQRHLLGALAGQGARVEAARRPDLPEWSEGRSIAASFSEDEGPGRRMLDAAWLVGLHPARCVRGRRRGGSRESVRALAPAARRVVRGAASRVIAGPSAEDAARAFRVARLAGLPLQHERAVADASAHDGDHLDQVVEDQVRRE